MMPSHLCIFFIFSRRSMLRIFCAHTHMLTYKQASRLNSLLSSVVFLDLVHAVSNYICMSLSIIGKRRIHSQDNRGNNDDLVSFAA